MTKKSKEPTEAQIEALRTKFELLVKAKIEAAAALDRAGGPRTQEGRKLSCGHWCRRSF